MTLNGWLQILLFLAVVLAVTKPLGLFMARVFEGERTFLHPLLRPIERLMYRLTGVDEAREMRWTEYAAAMLLFSLVSMLLLYVVQRLQGLLPLNPQGLPGVDSGANGTGFVASAFNTAASFTTNTNWQSYEPARLVEPQAVETDSKDAGGGVLTNPDGTTQKETLQVSTQTIAQGPVASQEAIKMLGTNGGGFFNANSAHPFENPTPFSNFLEMLAIFIIPAALTVTLGQMVGSPKHGWAVLAAMGVLWFAATLTCYWAESNGNPLL